MGLREREDRFLVSGRAKAASQGICGEPPNYGIIYFNIWLAGSIITGMIKFKEG